MTREEKMAIILTCSGVAGEIEFNRLSKVEFINWFRENISTMALSLKLRARSSSDNFGMKSE